MKAEEFEAVVRNLKDVIGIIEANTDQNDRRRYQLCLLRNAWANLDRHWLEMEAAETDKQPAPDIPEIVLESRFERIEERLKKIEKTIDFLTDAG